MADVGSQDTPFGSTAATGGGSYTLNTYLLDKEGLGEVLSRVKNPPQSPLAKGGRKQDDLAGNGTRWQGSARGAVVTQREWCVRDAP